MGFIGQHLRVTRKVPRWRFITRNTPPPPAAAAAAASATLTPTLLLLPLLCCCHDRYCYRYRYRYRYDRYCYCYCCCYGQVSRDELLRATLHDDSLGMGHQEACELLQLQLSAVVVNVCCSSCSLCKSACQGDPWPSRSRDPGDPG